MSDHADYYDEVSDDGTGYSEFCDDDTIRAAEVAPEYSSGASATASVVALGKRKSPDDSALDDGSPASYRRRTISDLVDLDPASGSLPSSGLPVSSGATLPDSSLPSESSAGPLEGDCPYIIAHNASVQRAMDARGLPWGVQWEIARLISLGHCTWKDITMEKLDILRAEGLSPSVSDLDHPTPAVVLGAQVAPYIEDLFRWNKHSFGSKNFSKEMQATSPYEELDKEGMAFLQHGSSSCLGFTSGLGPWYGGKVTFTIRLQAGKTGGFHFFLEPPVLGSSTRFTRCYGSSWLIKLQLSKDIFSKLDRLKSLLLRPFILNGQVFQFFYANKECNIYLMATNAQHGTFKYPSFLGFFLEHNNLKDNCNQTIAKWAARVQLGLSNSVPGLMLDNTQIKEEVDIVSSSCPSGVKHTSEMDMTDGCGLINLQAIYMLHKELGLWKEAPVAIQCRLAGAKGLLLLHPGKEENSWAYPCVWLRPSQVKIKLTESYLQNPAHRVIDTLRASNMNSSVQVSREIIINLSENGVPPDIFIDLSCQSLKDTISSLLNWDGQDAMPQLWATVSREGHVMAARVARESSWTARARGVLLHDQEGSNEDHKAEDDNSSSHSTAWWGDDISGCPSSLEETVMAFLDTGFHPMSNSILAEKLYIIAKKAIKSSISKSRVTIPMSCSAFIIPDVLGVLQEGEIHVKCSQRCLLRSDGQRSDRVIGDVLVTRNPCKLPTDVQKVKAVFKPELEDYVNVIVFSIKGHRSLASMLGTGDYDGDTVVCIWQPSIVKQFSNADARFMVPPPHLQDQFHIKNETVKEFLERVPTTSPVNHQIQELQLALMSPLSDLSAIGTYSNMHDNAVYSLGYTHPTTILLAWIFCTVLDGAKTGKAILPERYSQDCNSKLYGRQYAPNWKREPDSPIHQYNLSRQGLPPFVMDVLQEAMGRIREEQLQHIASHFSALPKVKDLDLVTPWQDAEERAREMLSRPEQLMRDVGRAQKEALEAIKTHVARVYDWCVSLMRIAAVPHATSPSPSMGKSVGVGMGARLEFSQQSIETRQDRLRRMSRKFVGGPPAGETIVFSQEEVARLRASYAYLYDWTRKHGGTRFPWTVAMRELGAIKLRARKDFKPISQDFYEKMSMRKL